MTAKINKEFDVKVNTKRIRRLMNENDKLSVVRRKRLTEVQYKRRKEQKDNLPKDLLRMNFFLEYPERSLLKI